jgi:hypothetical protein
MDKDSRLLLEEDKHALICDDREDKRMIATVCTMRYATV